MWTREPNRTYGRIKDGGIEHEAHVLSYTLAYGAIPNGLWVLHRCDVPRCVRPDHLFLGTAKDNACDRSEKGRSFRGDRMKWSKATPDGVRTMRALHARGDITYVELGRKFNMTPVAARRIVVGQNWKHIS